MATNPANRAHRTPQAQEIYRREKEKVDRVKKMQDHVFATTGKRPSFGDALIMLERQDQDEQRTQLELQARRATATLSETDPAEESRQLHEAVVSFREQNPETSYRDALIIVDKARRKARFATVGDTLAVDKFREGPAPVDFLDTHNKAVAMQRKFTGLSYADAVLHVQRGTEPKRRPSAIPMARTVRGGRSYYKFSEAEDFVCMGHAGAVA